MSKRVSSGIAAIFLLFFPMLVHADGVPAPAANPTPSIIETKQHGSIVAGSQTCTSCHQFDEAKFASLMHNQVVKILNKEIISGLWQVLYEPQAGQRNVIYTSLKFDKIFYGQILGSDGKNYTRDYMNSHANRMDTSGIPVRDAIYVMGNRDAKNKIFVFDDLDCIYCARLHFELKSFLMAHKDYAVYVMLFPTPSKVKSEDRARAVYCTASIAEREAVIENSFRNALENNNPSSESQQKCDISGLERVKQYAVNVLKIKTTPVMLMPDGSSIEGFVSNREIEDILFNRPLLKEAVKDGTNKGAPNL